MLCYVNKMTCIRFVAMVFFSSKYCRKASEKHRSTTFKLIPILIASYCIRRVCSDRLTMMVSFLYFCFK